MLCLALLLEGLSAGLLWLSERVGDAADCTLARWRAWRRRGRKGR
jgi:hypothetical protein